MAVYEVQWGGKNTRNVSNVDELDQLITEIEQQRGEGSAPFRVNIAISDDDADPFEREVLQVGIGHPSRSFAFWTGEGPGGYGREPGVPPTAESIPFDYAGQWTEYHPNETQVTAGTGKAAAREYVRTGARPTCVEWTS